MEKKKNWFGAKKLTASFAAVSLIVGFLFLDKGVTGNVIINNQNPVNVVSLIGLLLVFCSAVLAVYSTRR
ncbi:MAG TPA: hypothetical protein ENI22_00255 [Candidatus Pacearchaeota archaeon]|nr:hypothetical protein [Candidatus Pacearchaeota archaeon]